VTDEELLERACDEAQRRIETSINSVKNLAKGLNAGHKAAQVGDLNALHKALGELETHLQIVRAETMNAAKSWTLSEADEIRLFAEGGYVREFMIAAERAGLQASEEDGAIVCYPSLVKVDPARRSVLIDRKPYRNVRPSTLVAHLKSVQARPPRFRAAQFLESLFVAWDHARHLHAAGRLPGTDVRVAHIYAALTIAPGSSKEYSKPEFGRDLYLLEQSGERVTKKGARLHFGRSTGTKTTGGAITVVGEDGRRVDYSSISFDV
jgi:hypothetical protein